MTINWNELPDSAIVYLSPKLAKKLIVEGISRSGSKRQLVKHVLLYKSRAPDVTFLRKVENGTMGVVKFRLERLLKFLDMKPEAIDHQIIRVQLRRHS